MAEYNEFASLTDRLAACEAEVLQYQFQDRSQLEKALTHASVAKTRLESNERLEFLGDAILGALICEMLYHRFPEYPEGELTRVKSNLVSRNTCAALTEELGLTRFLLLGKGLAMNERIPVSILAGVFESVVAAIYLDGGQEAVRSFVGRAFAAELERTTDFDQSKNYKSLLQQMAQKTHGETPLYHLLDEKGPDHSKCFKISAAIGPQVFSAAWGNSKKEAEQRAALNALHEIAGKELPFAAD
ncbi:MAG: ribonuclease III [Planctomycetaceae bacterium]